MENVNVKKNLDTIISEMASKHWLFTNKPGHDFMCQKAGKLSYWTGFRSAAAGSRYPGKVTGLKTANHS